MQITVIAHTGWTDPITFTLPDNTDAALQRALTATPDAETVAEAVWQAIEAPYVINADTLAGMIQRTVIGLRSTGTRFFGLTPGDVIKIGTGQHTYLAEVQPVGWKVYGPIDYIELERIS